MWLYQASGVKQEFQLEFVPYLREDNASEMQDTQQTQHVIETAKTSLETLLSIPLDSFLSVVIYDLECRQFLDSYLQFLERDYDLLIDSAGQGSQYKRFSDLFSDEVSTLGFDAEVVQCVQPFFFLASCVTPQRNEIHRYVLSVFVRPLAQSQQVKQLHVGLSNETHSVPNSQGQYENFLVESGFFSTSRLLDLANCYTALDDEPNDETKYLKWLRGIAKCLFGDNGVRRLIVFRREVTSSLGQTVSECVDKLTTVICTGCALEEGSSSESDEDLLKRAIGANLSNDDILMCSQIVEFLVEVVSTLSNVILSYPPLALSMVFESSDERASSAAAAASDPSVSLKGREFWDSSIISNLCYLYEHCIPLLAFCILDEEQCETALNGENKNLDELYNKSSLTKSLRYVAFQISRFLSGILMHSYLWLLDAKKVIGTDVRTQNTEELNAPSYLEEDAREVDSATISEKIFELVSSAYSSVVGLPDARDEDHSLILQGRKGKCFAEVFQVSSLESALRGLLRSIQKGHGTAFSLDEARKEYFIEEIEELLDSSGPSTAEPPAEMQDSGDAAFRKIKDIFPQIDDARVKEYLKLESNNVSRVIEHISEGTRPQNDSHVQPKSSSSALEEGRNDSDFQTKMKQLIRLQG